MSPSGKPLWQLAIFVSICGLDIYFHYCRDAQLSPDSSNELSSHKDDQLPCEMPVKMCKAS